MFLSKFSPKFSWQKIGAADAVLSKSSDFLWNIHQCPEVEESFVLQKDFIFSAKDKD